MSSIKKFLAHFKDTLFFFCIFLHGKGFPLHTLRRLQKACYTVLRQLGVDLLHFVALWDFLVEQGCR